MDARRGLLKTFRPLGFRGDAAWTNSQAVGLCGNVQIVASGRPYRVGLCHCLDCRKHHGALFHASAIFPHERFAPNRGRTRGYVQGVRELAKEFARAGRAPKLFIQVNIGEEPQKAGVAPAEIDALLAECRALGLTITGLMCIPPNDQPPAPFFARLHELARTHGLAQLSMGMSGDFEIAVQHGATHVRVGSAIFGARISADQPISSCSPQANRRSRRARGGARVEEVP